MNIHGAIELASGQTIKIGDMRIDAAPTIRLLDRVAQRNLARTRIYIFGDNAAYHKSKR